MKIQVYHRKLYKERISENCDTLYPCHTNLTEKVKTLNWGATRWKINLDNGFLLFNSLHLPSINNIDYLKWDKVYETRSD